MKTFMRLTCIFIIASLLVIQVLARFVHEEAYSPLPPLFGNFPANRAILEKQIPKKEFSFAVIGDTRGYGGYETIAKKLSTMPVDFLVNLGDCTTHPTPESHQYFRAELAKELVFPYPVFYVAGNHDVSTKHFPISRFERDYGPSTLSFVYQDCLFVVLSYWDTKPDVRNYAFLEGLLHNAAKKYRYKFVFMHKPIALPETSGELVTTDAHLTDLLNKLQPDYVFAGHVHLYFKTKLGKATYIVTGGGGAPLYHRAFGEPFNHALVMNVDEKGISEKIIPFTYHEDYTDFSEYIIFTKVWPWMTQNEALVFGLDLIFIILLLILVKSFAMGMWNILTRREPI
jgi:predicted phosphodiesterase